MPADLLAGAAWECAPVEPGAAATPAELTGAAATWWPATVPGTAAGALRSAGAWHEHDARDFDAEDWWFRCAVPPLADPGTAGLFLLRLGGLATIADVWLDGAHLLHSENMFEPHVVEVPAADLRRPSELLLRFAALRPLLAAVRDRPRWRTRLVADQGLRRYRTTLLGRITGWADGPAPVGPWRAVTLEAAPPVRVVERHVEARCAGEGGVVSVRVRLAVAGGPGGGASSDGAVSGTAAGTPPSAVLHLGDEEIEVGMLLDGDEALVEGDLQLPQVERWWPHTHGPQPRYAVALTVGGQRVELGRVGFRTVTVDREDGAFTLSVNGVPLFCRGACWVPVDPVSLAAAEPDVRSRLVLARAAGMNMVRVTGTMVYEDASFFDTCDELGVLVWQDCMLADLDPPEDEDFAAAFEAEVAGQLRALGGRPSVAIVCGGSQVEQQAAMLGLERSRWHLPLLEQRLPALVERTLPGVPYVTSSPTGGLPPFRVDSGVAHYFGVGAYLRSLDDARRSGVRFASECLAFSVPPSSAAVDDLFGGASAAGHDPRWKLGVPRDAASGWDFEDVRDHYVESFFGVDVRMLRRADPERALDLGRAATAALVEAVVGEWRRPGSSCRGAIVLSLADLWPGAGWGLLDSAGEPKATYYGLARASAPLAVLITDEGLNGLAIHCCNDSAGEICATLAVDLVAGGARSGERAERSVSIPARGGITLGAEEVLGGFRDVSHAYRFGPPAHDAVVATLSDPAGALLSRALWFPPGPARPVEPDVGLEVEARAVTGEAHEVELVVTSRRLAQFTTIEVPGFRPSDSFFHLPPGASQCVRLTPLAGHRARRPVRGQVRALNSAAGATVRIGAAT